MTKSRLEAFSDGVIAIIITIMVLELRPPHEPEWSALRLVAPKFLTYALSFVYLGIYWNNHHHMLHATRRVSGAVLWANLHLLFWLSLIPFATGWLGESGASPPPAALYGGVLLFAAAAYSILQTCIIRAEGPGSALAAAVGRDSKGKLSLVGYAAAIPLAYVNGWISVALYVLVAGMWLIPDRRIESTLSE
jgi:uncharacterized membrane protein